MSSPILSENNPDWILTALTDVLLSVLGELIACDTQNPPRGIGLDHTVFAVVRHHLGRSGFVFREFDHGEGCVSLLAMRGSPPVLFNVHLDTVPAGSGWTHDPFSMRIDDGRVIGRGACDIKGAAAAMMAVAVEGDDSMAILFTSDEEGTGNCCVRNFCESGQAAEYRLVLVAEPTECFAVRNHRGYLSVTGEFSGIAAHSSCFDRLDQSANHRAIRWASEALERVSAFEQGEPGGPSLGFNIGRLDGGSKNNVIADRCRVSWSTRTPCGWGNERMLELVRGECDPSVRWTTTFSGEPLPNAGTDIASANRITEDFCRGLDLPAGAPVDFWTEAAIFSEFGIPAIVLGPGNIAQAHAVGEWVAVDQLRRAVEIYRKIRNVGS